MSDAESASSAVSERSASPEATEEEEQEQLQEQPQANSRAAKNERLAELKRKLDADKSKSAKERFRFLLQQSEIYSHFVTGNGSKAEQSLSPRKVAKGSSRRGRITEADEDRVLVEEALDDENKDEEKREVVVHRLFASPPFITGKMRDYQVEGVNWLIKLYDSGINGILADEMGLGKTLQTIAFLGYLKHMRDVSGPHLVVVPKSVLGNWMREFQRWCPSMKVFRFHGSQEERESQREAMIPGEFDVLVTTFEMVSREKSTIRKFSWRYVIMDEAHRIKNEKSQLAVVMRTFDSQYRLLLTGTPLQNNLHELWALLNFLLPDIFDSSEDFDSWFHAESGQAETEIIEQLHKVLKPFMLRRLKVDVEQSIPPKKEVLVHCGLSEVQKKLYRNILFKDVAAINGITTDRVRLLNIVMQLRKCCNHPYLFEGVEPGPPYTTDMHLITASGKLALLDRLLAKLKAQGSRVLIFSQMTRVLDILEDYLLFRGHEYCRIDGQTETNSREEYMDEFNKENSSKFCFLLSTRAGGLGINLATADVVILFDSDWNPQADLQAQDRAHRIGQRKPVTVLRLVTEGTVEEKVIERAMKKLFLDAMVIQQGRLADQTSAVSKNELMSMIRFGAEQIFKSSDSTVTDEDIDVLLAQGEDRFNKMNANFKQNCTNNLLAFSLTEDSSLYTFEGVALSSAPTDTVRISGLPDDGSVTVEDLLTECDKSGTISGYKYDPTKGYAMVRFESKEGAVSAVEGLNGKSPFKSDMPLVVEFTKSNDSIFSISQVNEWMPKRDRGRAVYSEDAYYREILSNRPVEPAQPKGPRMPKQVTVNDFQFMNKARIDELNEKERNFVLEHFAAKTTASHPDNKLSEAELSVKYSLTPAEEEERKKLLSQGFLSWSKKDFYAYVRALEKYGRKDVEAIAKDVEGKGVDEVRRYHRAFWEKYSEIAEYDRIIKRIEKAEAQLEKNSAMQAALEWKISQYEKPFLEMNVPYGTKTKSPYTEDEDRYLISMTGQVGYGNWETLKIEIRAAWELRFDWFLKSRSPQELGRRVESLVRHIQKEYEEELARQAEQKKRSKTPNKREPAASASESTPRNSAKKRSASEDDLTKTGSGKKGAKPPASAKKETPSKGSAKKRSAAEAEIEVSVTSSAKKIRRAKE
eukprot:ANDGO_05544.mRNA.1 putative chromatin-remodeling complex ATPase chain